MDMIFMDIQNLMSNNFGKPLVNEQMLVQKDHEEV